MSKPRYLVALDAAPTSTAEGPYVAEVEQGNSRFSTRYLAVADYTKPAGWVQESDLSPQWRFEMPDDQEPAYALECDVAGIIDLWHDEAAQDKLLESIDDEAIEHNDGPTLVNASL